MEIKKFKGISVDDLEKIINKHFNHWSKYSPLMSYKETEEKFKKIYAVNNILPYGLALYDNNNLIGFCVLKSECLVNYLEYNPWISDVMIFDEFRSKGYGRHLIDFAKKELKELGYDKVYLWTDKAPVFYEKLGFTYIKEVLKNDETGYGKLYGIDI